MSAVVVLTPVLITAWPMLVASVTSAAAAAGFRVVTSDQEQQVMEKKTRQVEIAMENMDVVADSLSRDDKIVVEREGVQVTFSRDARGHFKTCVEGLLDKEELRAIGETLAGQVVQQYVYRRLQEELQQQGFTTLDEEQTEAGAIRLHVRRYEN